MVIGSATKIGSSHPLEGTVANCLVTDAMKSQWWKQRQPCLRLKPVKMETDFVRLMQHIIRIIAPKIGLLPENTNAGSLVVCANILAQKINSVVLRSNIEIITP